MRRIWVTGVMALILVANPTGCGSKPAPTSQSSSAAGAGKILVFAAASLKPTFTQIAEHFTTDNPGADVDFDFAGSSELATQLTQGATADVFASADIAQMNTVAGAGLLNGTPVNFASNSLAIVTAPGNPKNVQSFADLTKPGLSVVICQQPVPCGAAAQRVQDKSGVRLNPVSEEPNVTDVLNKVTTGQADAGLVYITDAAHAGTKVTTVRFPQADDAVNVYPIAVLKEAPGQALAQKFVDLVAGDTGQKILDQAGFGKP